ncbi:mitochondrial enzyme D-lactate ferricytochrome c oxidoreductase [Scheffersomyces xylosifermentans]|uniref:mitochondrial enzyme D-lactate ferricytochrome c oxidoreductase n=1 Tax=Scheffersomyces xylosifermentans TaxID=1304137 RepID=UPI00315DE9B1
MLSRTFLRASRAGIRRQVSLISPLQKRYASSSSSANAKGANSIFAFLGGSLVGALTYKFAFSPGSQQPQEATPDPIVADFSSYLTSISTLSTLPLSDLESPVYASREKVEQGLTEIREIFKKNTPKGTAYDDSLCVNNTKEELDSHSDTYFNSHHALPEERPLYVVYPRSTQEVSEIMKVCHKYRIPVVPTSGRSSLEGHFIPTRGGITIDISNMNQIVKLDKTDLDITVQGGVGWEELADYLEEYNLLFSSDPGPGATISGICANNASGTNASRYGETYKNVLNLTVVLADGTVIKTKQRPRKSSAGYNLNSLFIGSEGTLGIITEATLKLHVKPVIESVIVVPFNTIEDAANSVNEILLKGMELNAIELLDDKMMQVINISGETTKKWQVSPTLFLKVGGSNQQVVNSLIQQIKGIVGNNKNLDFQFASNDDEKTELWSARKVALWSTINRGKEINDEMLLWTTDAAVPISNLPQFLKETKADIDNHGLKNSLVAHIGDGNAHSFILYLPSERDTAEKVVNNMVQRAIRLDGTCTGEHGIGFGKRDFLVEEVGELPIAVMRKIKLALDPLRILNPDKVFKIDPNEKGH